MLQKNYLKKLILEKLKIEEGKKIFIWTDFFEYVNAKILTNLNYIYLKYLEAKPSKKKNNKKNNNKSIYKSKYSNINNSNNSSHKENNNSNKD